MPWNSMRPGSRLSARRLFSAWSAESLKDAASKANVACLVEGDWATDATGPDKTRRERHGRYNEVCYKEFA